MSDVFISYSRKDVAFAHILVDALKSRGLETWIDWEDIPPSADWLNEIYHAIEAADTFVYIVSNHSKNSEVCSKEVQHAIQNHKRLVPIVINAEIKATELPADIAALNWIFFPGDTNITQQAQDFQLPFDKLLVAIQTDLAWVKAHTRLQVSALEWENRRHDTSVLLRGGELREVEAWLAQATEKKEPQPTTLQRQFVLASRQDADRRQRITLGAVLVGLVIAIVLAIVAFNQSQIAQANALAEAEARGTAVAESYTRATAEANAIHQKATAEAASTLAVQQRDEAQHQSRLALAGKLAAQSQLLFKDQLDLALLLSVEAFDTADTKEARLSPRLALEYSPYLRHFLRNDANRFWPFATSPNGKALAVVKCIEAITGTFPIECKHSQVTFIDPATGQSNGNTLDVGDFTIEGIAYNQLDSGKTLILVGADLKEIAIWEIARGSLVGKYPTGKEGGFLIFSTPVFSPDGQYIAIGGCSKGGLENCFPGEVLLWDVEKRQPYGQPISAHDTNVLSLAFSPDSQLLAAAGSESLSSHSIRFWDITNADEIKPVGTPITTTELIEALAFSPDGSLLAAGGSDDVITLWDVATHQQNGSALVGHAYWISALQFSPDGATLASGSWDDTLLLWDIASRQAIGRPLVGHNADVEQISFSADGQQLVSTGREGTLIMWDTSAQAAAGPLSQMLPYGQGYSHGVWTHAFSPDNRILAYNVENTIYLWDLQTDQLIGQPLEGHQDTVTSLVFPPQYNGERLVSASKDSVTIIWEVASGKLLQQTGEDQDKSIWKPVFSQDGTRLIYRSNHGLVLVGLPAGERQELDIADQQVSTFAINADGSLVAAMVCEARDEKDACKGWGLQVWNVDENVAAAGAFSGITNIPAGIALSPDGQWLAYSLWNTGKIIVVDRLSGNTTLEISSPNRQDNKLSDATSLVFSPDGKLLAAAYSLNNSVILWDLSSGQMVGSPFELQYNIGAPVFSSDGKILGWPLDKTPFLWDIAAQKPLGQPLQKGDASGSLAFSLDGQRVAIGGVISGELQYGAQVFDTTNGQPLAQLLNEHINNVAALAFDASGKQLSTLSQEGTLNVWNLGDETLTAQPLAGYLANYARVSLSPDGSTLAIATCNSKKILDDGYWGCGSSELWLKDTSSGELDRQPLSLDAATSFVRFSNTGKLLAIASGRQVIVWDVAAQKALYTLEQTENEINAMTFSPDDQLLAAKAEVIILWNLATGQPVGDPINDKTTSAEGSSLAGTEDFGVAFSPDGKLLATVSSVSGSILLIDLTSGQPFGPLLLDQSNKLQTGMLFSLSFSPDGKTLVSGNSSGETTLWIIDPAAWRQMACAAANRNLTAAEWAVYMPANEPYRATCK